MRSKLLIIFLFVLSACTGDKEQEISDDSSYYTCPMHPTVRSETPGACPICGMDLVKKEVAAQSEHANMVHLTFREEKRAGIETDSLREGVITTSTTFPGRITFDPDLRKIITAKISGRITRLYHKEPLAFIRRGEPVFDLYSEDLNSDLKEYMVLKEHAGSDEVSKKLAEAAKNKLILWGLSEQEIKDALNSKSSFTSTFLSDISGTISTIAINEGAYVQKGGPVLEVAGLEQVWVEITGYPGDVVKGKALVKDRSGNTVSGNIVLDAPGTVQGQSRQAFVSIKNSDGVFRPGEEVSVALSAEARDAFVLPRQAVIPGKMETVWLKTGRGMFEPRMVRSGKTSGDSIEILSGLNPGDRVVVKGAYLLNSEYILQKGAGAAHVH